MKKDSEHENTIHKLGHGILALMVFMFKRCPFFAQNIQDIQEKPRQQKQFLFRCHYRIISKPNKLQASRAYDWSIFQKPIVLLI